MCWVVPDLGYYHHARIEAFARRSSMRVTVLEMCDTSAFREFKLGAVRDSHYQTMTLYRDRYFADVAPGECCRAIGQALDQLRPDLLLVQGWSDTYALAPLVWCTRAGVPAIVASESQAGDAPRRSWKEFIKRRIVRSFASGLVGGTAHAEYLATLGVKSENIFVGYDVVDNNHFALGAAEARRDEGVVRQRLALPQRYFLASCRFIPKKNLARLIRAYALYRRTAGPEACQLMVLGDGAERNALERLVSELGIQSCVTMPGFKPYHELPAYYALAEAFVHASTTEQWGLVVNEAMACGLPLIVSDRCGCVPELVHPGRNGVTFDPMDVAGLAAALHNMAADDRGRKSMGAASQNLIANWTPETFANGLDRAVQAAIDVPLSPRPIADRLLLWSLLQRRIERSS